MISNRILILTSEFPPQPGGIGTHAFNLANELKKKGFFVTVICDIRSSDGREEQKFDASLDFEVKRISRKKLIILSYIKRVRTAFANMEKVDVVVSTGKFPLWLGGFLSRFYSKKYVAVIHGSELLLSNSFFRKLTNNSLLQFDLVIAVSRFTRSLVNNLPLKRVVVINNGIHLPKDFSGVNQNRIKPVLLTIGNVTRRKGQHNVIKALPVLLKPYPHLEYHVVGIPTEKEKFQQLASQFKVHQAVKFHGAVSENKKTEILKTADIFVMLSEATEDGDVEGFGIAVLEANAMGIPAIGAKGCGIEDAVKDGFSGLLVDNKCGKELLSSVEKILGNYSTYSENAREWAAGFSWDKVIEQYINEILEG